MQKLNADTTRFFFIKHLFIIAPLGNSNARKHYIKNRCKGFTMRIIAFRTCTIIGTNITTLASKDIFNIIILVLKEILIQKLSSTDCGIQRIGLHCG